MLRTPRGGFVRARAEGLVGLRRLFVPPAPLGRWSSPLPYRSAIRAAAWDAAAPAPGAAEGAGSGAGSDAGPVPGSAPLPPRPAAWRLCHRALVLGAELGAMQWRRHTGVATVERAVKMREAFIRLGPAFVKAGQALATRQDAGFPPEVRGATSGGWGWYEAGDGWHWRKSAVGFGLVGATGVSGCCHVTWVA
jgi:hypothetical protein